MKKLLCLLLLTAAVRAQTDPYAQLPAYDFGKDAAPITAIVKDVFDTKPAGYHPIEMKLLAALAKPDATYAAKKFICEQLRIVGSPASIGALVNLLGDEQTAPLARFALDALPGDAVDKSLLQALTTATGKSQLGLIQTLGARRYEKATLPLKDLLGSTDTALVTATLNALAHISGGRAVSILKTTRVAPELEPLRQRALMDAAFGLVEAGNKGALGIFEDEFKSGTSLPAIIAALNGIVACRGAEALPTVIGALNAQVPKLALAAAQTAQRLDGAAVTKELCAALPGLIPAVQVALVRSLALRGDKAALPAVKALLTAPTDAVKAEAALALEKVGDSSVVPDLITLATADGEVAAAAQQSLGRINAAGVNEAMAKMLDDTDAKKVRVAALTLKARADRSIMPRLLKMAASDKGDVRGIGLDALDGFAGLSELNALLALLDTTKDRDKLVSVIWKATAAVGTDEDRFLKLWNSGSKHPAALISLASVAGTTKTLQIATTAAKADDAALKEAAARTLFGWKKDVATESVVEIVKTTSDPKLKILGARAVVRWVTDRHCNWKPQKKIETLEQLQPSLTRPEDKKLVADAIENVKSGNQK